VSSKSVDRCTFDFTYVEIYVVFSSVCGFGWFGCWYAWAADDKTLVICG